mmetsp:Transcript_39647/g.127079  ORF Transcript_39647/g.127079 Transcript_39647/m.127079 type:complete len:84 (-) Transcript_39647:223-474(-)
MSCDLPFLLTLTAALNVMAFLSTHPPHRPKELQSVYPLFITDRTDCNTMCDNVSHKTIAHHLKKSCNAGIYCSAFLRDLTASL